jgi:short subunit dehydrogenase-like uncharacterized protein
VKLWKSYIFVLNKILSGEPLYIETVISLDERARAAGITLVPACGFDCVPSELSLMRIQKEFPDVDTIKGYVSSDNFTTANTGTLFTAIESLHPENQLALKKLRATASRAKSSSTSSKPPILHRAPKETGRAYALIFPGADKAINVVTQRLSSDKPVAGAN